MLPKPRGATAVSDAAGPVRRRTRGVLQQRNGRDVEEGVGKKKMRRIFFFLIWDAAELFLLLVAGDARRFFFFLGTPDGSGTHALEGPRGP